MDGMIQSYAGWEHDPLGQGIVLIFNCSGGRIHLKRPLRDLMRIAQTGEGGFSGEDCAIIQAGIQEYRRKEGFQREVA